MFLPSEVRRIHCAHKYLNRRGVPCIPDRGRGSIGG
jgi:hypothetical protein